MSISIKKSYLNEDYFSYIDSNKSWSENGERKFSLPDLLKKAPSGKIPVDPINNGVPSAKILNKVEKKDPKKCPFLQNCLKVFLKIIEQIKEFFRHLFTPAKKTENIEKTQSIPLSDLEQKLVNPNPKYPLITFKQLEQEGLLPKHRVEYENATYYFSEAFIFNGSNIARLAFIEIDGAVYPRIIYQSNSQATWRVMPAASKGFYNHIGKGKIETDTQLPLEVNLALHKLTNNKTPTQKCALAANLVKTELVFAPLQANPNFKMPSWNEKVLIHSFVDIKTNAPKKFVKGGLLVPNPPNPKDVKLPENPDSLPDFSKPLKETKIRVAHYGELKAKIFQSKDQKIKYLFYEAKDGKAFLGAVENVYNNPINEYGVRSSCPQVNHMDAPLLEYDQQIPQGYEAGPLAPRYISEKYANNWNFVRELPLIKLYYKEQGRIIPPKYCVH